MIASVADQFGVLRSRAGIHLPELHRFVVRSSVDSHGLMCPSVNVVVVVVVVVDTVVLVSPILSRTSDARATGNQIPVNVTQFQVLFLVAIASLPPLVLQPLLYPRDRTRHIRRHVIQGIAVHLVDYRLGIALFRLLCTDLCSVNATGTWREGGKHQISRDKCDVQRTTRAVHKSI